MAGPDLVKTNSVPIGMADILVGPSLSNIANTDPVLTHNDNSLGAMADTTLNGEVTVFELQAGNPQRIAEIIPIGETFGITCGYQEKTLKNLAFARGLDPTNFGGGDTGSGEIPIGNISASSDIRIEFDQLFPDGTKFVAIMPRAQVTPNVSMGSSADSPSEVSVTANSLPADSNAPGGVGDAAWDTKPLGSIRIKLD